MCRPAASAAAASAAASLLAAATSSIRAASCTSASSARSAGRHGTCSATQQWQQLGALCKVAGARRQLRTRRARMHAYMQPHRTLRQRAARPVAARRAMTATARCGRSGWPLPVGGAWRASASSYASSGAQLGGSGGASAAATNGCAGSNRRGSGGNSRRPGVWVGARRGQHRCSFLMHSQQAGCGSTHPAGAGRVGSKV